MATFGERVAVLRLRAGYATQEALGAALGHADGTQVSRWEHDTSRPQRRTLRALAQRLRCDEADLTSDTPRVLALLEQTPVLRLPPRDDPNQRLAKLAKGLPPDVAARAWQHLVEDWLPKDSRAKRKA